MSKKFKLTFADLVLSVFPDTENGLQYSRQGDSNIIEFNDNIYNLINDSKKKGELGLSELNNRNQVEWNTDNIVNYINSNKSISKVYFTRQINSPWCRQIQIIEDRCNVKVENIFTPSGQSLKGSPRILELLKHWLFNESDDFGNLSYEWLNSSGVDVERLRELLNQNNRH